MKTANTVRRTKTLTTKQEKQSHKNYRKLRQNSRGKQWSFEN